MYVEASASRAWDEKEWLLGNTTMFLLPLDMILKKFYMLFILLYLTNYLLRKFFRKKERNEKNAVWHPINILREIRQRWRQMDTVIASENITIWYRIKKIRFSFKKDILFVFRNVSTLPISHTKNMLHEKNS